ncbi:heme acquisition protein HasA [Rhizobium sp.]
MVVKIKIASSEGVNLNKGNASYLAELPLMFNSSENLGFFKNSFNNSPQYGVAESETQGGVYSEGAALVAGGKLSYSLMTHVVEGRLDSLSLGEGLNGAPTGGYISNGTMSVKEAVVNFTGLGLDSAKGGKVADILYGMMTGDEAAFVKFLAKTEVKFVGGNGDDVYKAGSKDDILSGGGGDDTLIGGGGKDKLTGGAGADTLTGGGGKDTFIFKSVTHSNEEAYDTITDFNGKKGDRIDLKGIDANTGKSGNQAFDFIGNDDFSGKAGELRIEKNGSYFDVYGDVNGDGVADLFIQVKAGSLSEGHFIL